MVSYDVMFESFAVPGAILLISFEAFSSQLLFPSLDPDYLTTSQWIAANMLVIFVLISYMRSCRIDPGFVPLGWKPSSAEGTELSTKTASRPQPVTAPQRWCRKCENFKPPRAHHCRTCRRCVSKMDHHCPWTGNCVGLKTFPHFIRFLFYTVIGMLLLQYILYNQFATMWEDRRLPSYLGPTVTQLVHLTLLGVVNSLTLFTLSILLIKALWGLGANTTTIEGWEIERHEALLKRARRHGGYLNGPNGSQIRLIKQEFPYDIGICENIAQSMGSQNPLAWFWPFSRSLRIENGLDFEVNGFEDPTTIWPPPDPDRMPVKNRDVQMKIRQELEEPINLQKYGPIADQVNRRQAKHYDDEVEYHDKNEGFSADFEEDSVHEDDAENWRNNEGETLVDYGVDE